MTRKYRISLLGVILEHPVKLQIPKIHLCLCYEQKNQSIRVSIYLLTFTWLSTIGLGIRLTENLLRLCTKSQRVWIWGISWASQIDWTWLDVVPVIVLFKIIELSCPTLVYSFVAQWWNYQCYSLYSFTYEINQSLARDGLS